MQQPPSGGKTKLTELTYEEQLQIKTRRRRDREESFSQNSNLKTH